MATRTREAAPRARAILEARAVAHEVVAAMLDGRLSREGPPFAALDEALDRLVEAAVGVKR
jgi:hypothetical protein